MVAASFGGLVALREVLSALPAELPRPVVVMLHRAVLPQDSLAEILSARTGLSVELAAEGSSLVPGRVSILPADRQARLAEDGYVRLEPTTEPSRPCADTVMIDAADGWRAGAMAVVLTGRLADGAHGVRAVKRAGGMVLVQDPSTCAAPGMPTAALATGCVDHRLPLNLIADAIVALTMVPGAARMLRVPAPPWAMFGAATGADVA